MLELALLMQIRTLPRVVLDLMLQIMNIIREICKNMLRSLLFWVGQNKVDTFGGHWNEKYVAHIQE